MANTYGLFAVGYHSFNHLDNEISYPQSTRTTLITCLKIHNLVLNILGYIPGVSAVSGCVRILSGIVFTNILSDLLPESFHVELGGTLVTQVTRGIFEAFVPYGFIVNILLDLLITPMNMAKSNLFCCLATIQTIAEDTDYVGHPYNEPFCLLSLV